MDSTEDEQKQLVGSEQEVNLKDLSFGLTMTLMGMGVTLLTLVLLIFVIYIMNKLFPFKKKEEKKD